MTNRIAGTRIRNQQSDRKKAPSLRDGSIGTVFSWRVRHRIAKLMHGVLVLTLFALPSGVQGQKDPRILQLHSNQEPLPAELSIIDDRWNFRFIAKNDRVMHVHGKEILSWGRLKKPARRPFILLADGGLVMLSSRKDILQLKDEKLSIVSRYWGEVNLPISLVRALVLAPPNTTSKADRLFHALKAETSVANQIELTDGDLIQGTILGFDQSECRFARANRKINVPTERVRLLRFSSSASKIGGLHALVGLKDGSQIIATSIQLTSKRLVITLGNDTVLTSLPFINPLRENVIQLIRPIGSRALYLSDLTSVGYKHIPYLTLQWPVRINQNLFGNSLQKNETLYAKGIAMHSTSRLAFQVPDDCARFESELAIDDSAKQRGSAVFRVFLEKESKWNEAYKSGQITGDQVPVACRVDLNGATGLALVVDFGDGADAFDHADWLNARFIRKRLDN